MKVLVGAFNQEKALVGAFLLLRDCEIFANLRLKFYWIMVSCHQPITISPYASMPALAHSCYTSLSVRSDIISLCCNSSE